MFPLKQLIVLISMLLLGIAIAGLILSFGDTAEDLHDSANSKIMTVFELTE